VRGNVIGRVSFDSIRASCSIDTVVAVGLFECLVVEEREVLQDAELSGELTQRTTSEAPQTMYFIGLDVHKKRETGRGPYRNARNMVRRSYTHCRRRQTQPGIVSGVSKPDKKRGSECSVQASDDVR
jgi:hypothetical protein